MTAPTLIHIHVFSNGNACGLDGGFNCHASEFLSKYHVRVYENSVVTYCEKCTKLAGLYTLDDLDL